MANSTTAADSLRHDFESQELNIPLKDASIVSLRALENGNESFETVHLGNGNTFWERLLMSIRRRRNGREPMPEHEPLRLPHEKDELLKKSYRYRWRKHGVPSFVSASAAIRHTRVISWYHGLRTTGILLMRVVVQFPICLMPRHSLTLFFSGIVHIANVFMSMVPVVWDDDDHSFLPTWGQSGELGEGLASYPTDFTRDVTPIMCHSHNDYWRRVPLFQALHYGCTGVEADVWLFDNELFVGHNTMSLTRNRTFRSLYVDPLVRILDQQNTINEFSSPSPNNTKNGVFDEDPSQTLVLLVDFKNSGEDIYPVVAEQLSALREKGYLAYFDGTSVVPGPITVVATGNAPFNLLAANTTYRDIFFDAPLSDLYEEPTGGFPASGSYHSHPPKFTQSPGPNEAHTKSKSKRNSGQGTVGTDDSSVFDATNSYYASVSFGKSIGMIWGGRLSHTQMKLIRGQIQGAKRRGLKVRYWNTPKWPVGLRNHVWQVLVREGVDYLNGDDLAAMTRMDWRKRRHHGWFSQ
ncbi:PLC-like phosphodiesterase [Clohesyomyces aquaticus]|uniref:Altered inheritance of mitochondria protein 6 n=1 Tax=Clohesyomyces aquaticus TaxID=1231657 RepID=A0A1Y1YYW7_9PLEO|nr:PLC-like phosphodiesterase [Clohesyomyces aquaticus]